MANQSKKYWLIFFICIFLAIICLIFLFLKAFLSFLITSVLLCVLWFLTCDVTFFCFESDQYGRYWLLHWMWMLILSLWLLTVLLLLLSSSSSLYYVDLIGGKCGEHLISLPPLIFDHFAPMARLILEQAVNTGLNTVFSVERWNFEKENQTNKHHFKGISDSV